MNGDFIGQSIIQKTIKSNGILHTLKTFVREFVEKYDTDNMVIGLHNNIPQELENGFLSISATFENLEEALDNMKDVNEAIQLLNRENNGRVYRIGTLKPLTECADNETIVNIKTLKEL